jgi:phosphohistidine phosphatase
MRQLLIYRHAKAEKSDGDLSDRERRLMPRGRRQCESIGAQLREKDLLPDVVITSPAYRARETAHGTTEAADLEVAVREDERLYDATPRSFVSVLQDLGDTVGRVMLVGHNPVVEELVAQLCGSNLHMKTANLAVLESELGSWKDLAPDTRFSLRHHLTPAD